MQVSFISRTVKENERLEYQTLLINPQQLILEHNWGSSKLAAIFY